MLDDYVVVMASGSNTPNYKHNSAVVDHYHNRDYPLILSFI